MLAKRAVMVWSNSTCVAMLKADKQRADFNK